MSKSSINFEKINITEYDIDDNIKFLLYMGVGLFSKDLDSDYTNKVLEMLQNCELAYIIADESFCYGANYLISNVIINDDIGDSHSINTILQLIGRTARVGKSWSGKVYLDTNTTIRIKEFFMNPSFTSVEGTNIIKYFKDTTFEIVQEIQNEKCKVEDEKHKVQNLKSTQIPAVNLVEFSLNKITKPNDSNTIENNKQIVKEEIEIIKSGTPNDTNTSSINTNTFSINTNTNLNESYDYSNDIYTWKRGKNFKYVESGVLIQPQTQTQTQTQSSETNELWVLKSNQESELAQSKSTKSNKMSLYEEWGEIRGKNKSIPKSELFVPKSFDELNSSKLPYSKFSDSKLSDSKLNSKLNSTNVSNLSKLTNTHQKNNYEQFDNINMFKKITPKEKK
jgi:hypothetical protein